MTIFRCFALLIVAALSLPAFAAEYSITQIKDNLYRYSSGTHHAVFVVTDEGIALTDPISHEGASWLKQELKKRFKQPVRYVIYSHSHHDHVYGGEVFDEPGVTFIAHEWARDELLATRANTKIPNLVFNDELTLHLGDTQIDLRYHGPNNGKGAISMNFPKHRVLHVVDWIVLGRMPYKNLPGYDVRGMINSTRDVLEMDFDLLVGGHAEMGDKDDVRDYLNFVEQLYTAVLEGMRAGKSLETLQQEIRMDEYQHLAMYEEWLPQNIEGIYNELRGQSYLLLRPEVNATE